MKHSKNFLLVLAAAGMTIEAFDEKTKDLSDYDLFHEKIKMCVDHENGPEPGECIWYPWFWKEEDTTKPSGVGLSLYDTVLDHSGTNVPARLKYKSKPIAAKAGKTYLTEYEGFLLATK